jgi:23S rRNA (uracil1939-C5)-methyltransferase
MSQGIVDLFIEALVYGGSGLGYHDGKVVFVAGTAPGDRVRCRVSKSKKRFAEAQLEEVLQPSPERCPADCPVFGQCGGCQWQHLPYAEQCSWKEKIFIDLLRRQAGVAESCLHSLVAAPGPWGYRSRAQLKLRQVKGQLAMGFYRRGSHFIIDHRHCAILHPRLNETAQLFRSWLSNFRHVHRIPQLDLGVGDDGRVRAVLHYLDKQAEELKQFLRPLVAEAGIALFLQTGRKETLQPVWGAEDLCIKVGEPALQLAYGPGGFAQINLEQNRRLVKTVVDTVSLCGAKRVLDLYCGMGNLSLPVANQVDKVVGVEDFAPAIAKARLNAETNRIANASFHHLPAEGAATSLTANSGPFDLVMLDPPRSGAFKVVKELLNLRPRHILYVSCEPPTLVRDLQSLLHGGYDLVWSQPYDLFPQTHHIESITLLCLKDDSR